MPTIHVNLQPTSAAEKMTQSTFSTKRAEESPKNPWLNDTTVYRDGNVTIICIVTTSKHSRYSRNL